MHYHVITATFTFPVPPPSNVGFLHVHLPIYKPSRSGTYASLLFQHLYPKTHIFVLRSYAFNFLFFFSISKCYWSIAYCKCTNSFGWSPTPYNIRYTLVQTYYNPPPPHTHPLTNIWDPHMHNNI